MLFRSQRYMPELLDKIEPLLNKHQLESEDIVIRMTGCPNGCARPYAAEIAFIGTAPGKYNLQLGGDNQGQRLNKTFKESLDEKAILEELDNLFASFKNERQVDEKLGDFVMRKELV